LPLSLIKLSKEQFQPIIDRISDQLPGWKADLMTRAGRVVQVQHVLTAMFIYLAMAVDLPPWAIKAIDKIRRAFVWRGRKEVKGLGLKNLNLTDPGLAYLFMLARKSNVFSPWP
jgi:hypothetical protein